MQNYLRKLFLSGCLILPLFCFAQYEGAELIVTGVYKGLNLYVQNPTDDGGKTCIKNILINNKPVAQVPSTSAFNLDLSFLNENEKVVIKFFHGEGCVPKVLNPHAIRVDDVFNFTQIDVNDVHLVWETKGEKRYGKYFILRLVNDQWIREKAVDSKALSSLNTYEVEILHKTGQNFYKITYLDPTGKSFESEGLEHISRTESVDFYPKRVSDVVNFTRPVAFQILDQYGKLILEGTGGKVDVSNLERGVYYLHYDNKTDTFLKKK
jgi:hypothetical protein